MTMMERPPVNILVVDDQPSKLMSVEAALSELGENILKASSANEALGILLKNDVAVVLVDVCMPDLDGFQLVEMIRQHPRFEKTAIIFVSAILLNDIDRIRGYQSGAVDYVPVPVVPEILRAKVRVFVDLYRKTRQLEDLASELELRVAQRTSELQDYAARLEEGEEQLKQALTAASMGTWRRDLTALTSHHDSNLNMLLSRPADETVAPLEAHAALISPLDRARVETAWRQAIETGDPYEAEYRIADSDNEPRWVREQGRVLKDIDGRQFITGLTQDISERKRAEQAQVLLIEELNHRVKNMLATVQAIASQTLKPVSNELKAGFLSRLQALAACHDVLTRTQWRGAKLADIVNSTFEPHKSLRNSRITAAYDDSVLASHDALSLTLALHELTTNALKYGALSTADGSVTLHCAVKKDDDASLLQLDWREKGGPPVSPPEQTGFGSRLLKALASKPGGAYVCDYGLNGFTCKLSIAIEAQP